jgi:hypothetical protein
MVNGMGCVEASSAVNTLEEENKVLKLSLRSMISNLEPYLVRTIEIDKFLHGSLTEGTAQAIARLIKAKRLL